MGILNPLYEAVAWVFKQIYNVLSPLLGASSGATWALTIVILVILMRLIMVPLFVKQMHTTRAMTTLAPQMTALRKKYKNDKQTLNQEMMKLYQEAGVNPLMGCLPVVAQLPMFFALFSVLRAISDWKPGQPAKYGFTTEMMAHAKQASIFGAHISDKFLFSHGVPLEAKIIILIAVLVSMATTYLTVRQSMKRGMMPTAPDNPMGQSQKYMAYIMPLFALSGLYWPFGLVLYWVTTNLWTLGQQWLLFRRYPQPGAALADGAGPTVPVTTVTTVPARKSGRPNPAANGSAPASVPPSGSTPAKAAPGTKNGPAPAKGNAAKASPAKTGASPAKASPAKASPAKASPAKASAAKSAEAKSAQAKSATGAKPRTGPGTSAPASPGQASGNGVLRRLSRRSEPEPEPTPTEVKLVRQQRQRQSRSKRGGKR